MAVLDIIKYGDPVLRRVAQPFQDGELTETFVSDMVETMKERDGVGLAAPQIGISKRLIVASVMNETIVLINPEIVAYSERKDEDAEGCLSLPGIQGNVARHVRIVVKGQKPDGEEIEISAKGLMARVIQHEMDHLNGILFIDRSNQDTIEALDEASSEDNNTKYKKISVQEIQSRFKKTFHQEKQDLQFDGMESKMT